jgi:hypothetical protein
VKFLFYASRHVAGPTSAFDDDISDFPINRIALFEQLFQSGQRIVDLQQWPIPIMAGTFVKRQG